MLATLAPGGAGFEYLVLARSGDGQLAGAAALVRLLVAALGRDGMQGDVVRPRRHPVHALGGEPSPMTPAQFGAKAAEDSRRFGAIIRERKIVGD